MSIELHCPHCGKLIRAPDEAGGKRGKCPYCGNSAYIPTPAADDSGEIGLAPIDEEDERHEEELRRESIAYTTALDKEAVVDADDESAGDAGARQPEIPGEVIDVAGEVEHFILAMRDSKLDEAERAVAALKETGTRATDYIQGLMVDEMPPQIENVPPPLMKGFLKTLLGRLS